MQYAPARWLSRTAIFFFDRSGMTISQTAEILAEMLHGVTFGAPTEGVHWCWMDQVGRYYPATEVGRTI